MNQPGHFALWLSAIGCFGLLVLSRLLTNRHVAARQDAILESGTAIGHVPRWVSGLYMVGFLGLVACVIWSFFISWWAPLVLLALYVLSGAIPSRVLGISKQAKAGRHKRCTRCGAVRPISYFGLNASAPDGHVSECVACDQPAAWAAVQEMKSAFPDTHKNNPR